ncbi:mitochondrial import inner membrane translocase subunit Tim21 isoform X2 [Dryobates pubescens]|uniref:mitochondrial import inner membrane translocase subunit Tim21 isoform X2 n=1 Tax=Dryobates pubescens TaxID=118200 RepID=UPI0023B8CCE9|nr:mitochondrial import inner membrane translocase subunit Tim21 isoform X2 [Dryobates pubescens]
MLPASLARVRACREWRRIVPGGWALLGPGPCPGWWQSIGTQAGGLRAEKAGGESKHVSVQRAQREETLLSAAQKVKEAGRDFTYFIVVLVGIGVTGGLFYVIFKELFSSSSPSKIYGDALEKCRSHPEVVAVFGDSIKGYGEATRRGRRQLVRILREGNWRSATYLWMWTPTPGESSSWKTTERLRSELLLAWGDAAGGSLDSSCWMFSTSSCISEAALQEIPSQGLY